MKVALIVIGKTDEEYLTQGVGVFENRLKHYLPYEQIVIPALKNTKGLSLFEQKKKEGGLLLKSWLPEDHLILLDEKGKEYTSVELANYFQKKMNAGIKRLVFVVGGPYGFSDEVYARANAQLALSKMTFSHQMIRLFFVEQVYRAMTILKNEQYHNQ